MEYWSWHALRAADLAGQSGRKALLGTTGDYVNVEDGCGVSYISLRLSLRMTVPRGKSKRRTSFVWMIDKDGEPPSHG